MVEQDPVNVRVMVGDAVGQDVDAVVAVGGIDEGGQDDLAVAATITAYQTWPADESFDDFLQRLEHCLREAGPAGPTG